MVRRIVLVKSILIREIQNRNEWMNECNRAGEWICFLTKPKLEERKAVFYTYSWLSWTENFHRILHLCIAKLINISPLKSPVSSTPGTHTRVFISNSQNSNKNNSHT